MGFDTALKRYFAGVILALLAVAAYFQASGITQLVGSALSPDEKALVGSNPGVSRLPAAIASALRPDRHSWHNVVWATVSRTSSVRRGPRWLSYRTCP